MKLSYRLGYTLFKTVARGFFNYRTIGDRDQINKKGAALIVCNHASFLDPPLVGIAFDEDIYYLAKKTLFVNKTTNAIYRSWNAIPVDQEKADMSSLKTVIRLLKKGKKVLIFPEGSRTPNGAYLPGLPGVGFIIAKANVPVFPMRLVGTQEALPMGGRAFHPVEVKLIIGKSWHYEESKYSETGKSLYQRISDDLMSEIVSLHD